jgi:hypothetical protein
MQRLLAGGSASLSAVGPLEVHLVATLILWNPRRPSAVASPAVSSCSQSAGTISEFYGAHPTPDTNFFYVVIADLDMK